MDADRAAAVPEGLINDGHNGMPVSDADRPSGTPVAETVATANLPLCVDLDGTLVKCDTLVDSVCVLARTNPALLLRMPFWLLRGKAAFKQAVTARAVLDAANLPYNEPLMVYLREQAAAGRPLFLSTGADHALAERVTQHVGLFDAMFSSDGRTNLTGKRKLKLLEEYFGPAAFAYIGNSRADFPLLAVSGGAMLANPTFGLASRLKRHRISIQNIFIDTVPAVQSVRRALRIHQWAKNLLIFLPLLLAHATGLATLLQTIVAFFSFSFVASSTYIANDLLDLNADRGHATKRQRPFAAGDLSGLTGMALAVVLFAAGVALSLQLAGAFTAWLLIYCGATLAYSLYFKRVVIIDVLILSGLYTLRILAGAAVAQVPISDWLAGFAIFFFFSLALVKRFSELENLRARGMAPTNGRGYLVHDLEQLRVFGTASAFASIVVFSLYITNPDVLRLYRHPDRLWLLTPVLIWWLCRVWMRASRGQMHEDPVVFALTDRASLLAGVVTFLIALSAAL